MLQIANPIYDVVFKGLMENEIAAKLFLSTLLEKKIVRLEPGRQEFFTKKVRELSIYRIDFSAIIEDENGKEERITIEIQKTWSTDEVGRFRQYLAKQYNAAENMIEVQEKTKKRAKKFGKPLISIYILGHLLPQVQEPVVYVKRVYLNHLKNTINYKDDFIESLSHDTIIVQVPLLSGKIGTKLERILSVFNQRLANVESKKHKLDFDDKNMSEAYRNEIEPIVRCLHYLGSDPSVQETMNAEDHYLLELEMNSEELAIRDKLIEKKDKLLETKDIQLQKQGEQLEEKDLVIAELKKQIQSLSGSTEK